MRMRIAPFAVALALAACGKSEPVADGADNTAGLNAVIAEANQVAEVAHDNADAAANKADDSGSNNPGQAVIPAQYRGRWGMVAGDCTSTRGDAKGLITIGDTNIRFYESTATLKEQRPAISEAFSGLYAFTGEGQNWTKVETLTRTGDTLKRADDEGNYSYKRCA